MGSCDCLVWGGEVRAGPFGLGLGFVGLQRRRAEEVADVEVQFVDVVVGEPREEGVLR